MTSLVLAVVATAPVLLECASRFGASAEWRASDCDGGDQITLAAFMRPAFVKERNMRRGLYRILGMGGRPNDVRVDDEGITVPVEEGLYRTRGYRPPVDDLPWEDDYLRRDASAKP